MAKKLLPPNYTSWIQLHDELKRTRPDLFKWKTIKFMTYTPEGKVVETYSISIAALERLCWQEINHFRIDSNLTHEAGSILHRDSFNAGRMTQVIQLLWKIEKKN